MLHYQEGTTELVLRCYRDNLRGKPHSLSEGTWEFAGGPLKAGHGAYGGTPASGCPRIQSKSYKELRLRPEKQDASKPILAV